MQCRSTRATIWLPASADERRTPAPLTAIARPSAPASHPGEAHVVAILGEALDCIDIASKPQRSSGAQRPPGTSSRQASPTPDAARSRLPGPDHPVHERRSSSERADLRSREIQAGHLGQARLHGQAAAPRRHLRFPGGRSTADEINRLAEVVLVHRASGPRHSGMMFAACRVRWLSGSEKARFPRSCGCLIR